jgi:hypothetical protein
VRGPGVVRLGEEAVFDVCVADTALRARALFASLLRYDAAVLTPVWVDAQGGGAARAALRWEASPPGELRVASERSFDPSPGPLLYRAGFRAAVGKHPAATRVTLPSVSVWARCCPSALPDTSAGALIDGSCAGIVVKSGTMTLAQNSPNPARERTRIAFSVAPASPGTATEASLYLYDLHGRPLRRLFAGAVPSGPQAVTVDVSDLQPGAYPYVLQSGGQSAVRTLMVLR